MLLSLSGSSAYLFSPLGARSRGSVFRSGTRPMLCPCQSFLKDFRSDQHVCKTLFEVCVAAYPLAVFRAIIAIRVYSVNRQDFLMRSVLWLFIVPIFKSPFSERRIIVSPIVAHLYPFHGIIFSVLAFVVIAPLFHRVPNGIKSLFVRKAVCCIPFQKNIAM